MCTGRNSTSSFTGDGDRRNRTSIVTDSVAVRFTLHDPATALYGGDLTARPVWDQLSLAWVRVIETPNDGHAYHVWFPASGSCSCRSRFCVASLFERCNSRSRLPGFS